MDDRHDRQQPMADHHHHRSRLPKKGGAGGTYTWGGPMDVTADEASYEPLGMQGPRKVTTDEGAATRAKAVVPPLRAVPQREVHPESAEEFPVLSARSAASAGAPAADSVWAKRLETAGEAVSQEAAAPSSTVVSARAQVAAALGSLQETAGTKSAEVLHFAQESAACAAKRANAKASELAAGACEVARDKSFQATAASAAGGAAVLGTGGGAAGLVTGTVVGAAVGLVPAVFTFGLSIPIGAAIGGGTGLVAGAAAGTAVGAVGGGAAGYGVYTKREQIADIAKQASTKVSDSAEYVKGYAGATAGYVKERAAAVRTRLVSGGTGSTEDRD